MRNELADRVETPCELWAGYVLESGYGFVKDHPTGELLAHRAALAASGVAIAGLQVHHRCGVRSCVALDHLEALTRLEHAERHHVSACVNGHALEGSNVYWYSGTGRGPRACKTCRREAGARWRDDPARRAAAVARSRAWREARR